MTNLPRRWVLGVLSLFLWAPCVLGDVDYSYGAPEGAEAASAAVRLPSPSGRLEIAFQKDNPLAGESVRHIRYIVSFYPPHQQTAIAQTVFVDVLDSGDSAKASSLHDLVRGILWSPKEDIAILPQERWPEGHPSKPRQAVSLMPTSSWQTADFPLEESSLIWIDPLSAAGNWTGHCQEAVSEFDGKTGKTTALANAETPLGYQIASATDAKLVMKRVLDDCATDADRAHFHPDCITLDLRFMRREVSTCP